MKIELKELSPFTQHALTELERRAGEEIYKLLHRHGKPAVKFSFPSRTVDSWDVPERQSSDGDLLKKKQDFQALVRRVENIRLFWENFHAKMEDPEFASRWEQLLMVVKLTDG